MKKKNDILTDQVAAGYIIESLKQKVLLQQTTIDKITTDANEKAAQALRAFHEANTYIEASREFVSPGHLANILGNPATKHGETAETLEVNFRNGRDVMNGLKATAKILDEGKDRIGPSDYIILKDQPVQSKFINGGGESTPNHSLAHILAHLKKYPGYATDTTPYGFPNQHGIYHIPKDQYEVLQKVLNGDIKDLNYSVVRACRQYITNIETETGKPIMEVVKPGINTYQEVQLGRVDETINKEEQQYQNEFEQKNKEIREEEKSQKEEASHITDASWGEAFKAAGISAAITATTSAGIKIYQKIKSGKKFTEFTASDWKEIGIDFGKGGAKGGISGLAIYGLSRVGNCPAPMASAIVSTATGITSLYIDYRKGNIDKSDFSDAACTLSVEAGLVAVGAFAGNLALPGIGGIVGSAIMQSVIKITEAIASKDEKKLLDYLQNEYDKQKNKLDNQSKQLLDEFEKYYQSLDKYIDNSNTVIGSVDLCLFLGITDYLPDSQKSLDNFLGYK